MYLHKDHLRCTVAGKDMTGADATQRMVPWRKLGFFFTRHELTPNKKTHQLRGNDSIVSYGCDHAEA